MSGGSIYDTVVLLNTGTGFTRANSTFIDLWGNDAITCADIDRDGRTDILKREYGTLQIAINQTNIQPSDFLHIEVVDNQGRRNQEGRVVEIHPRKHQGVTYTRVVDSGSGFLSQSPYELLVGTPYHETHDVVVYFATGPVHFSIDPGEWIRISPDGVAKKLNAIQHIVP